MFATLLESGPRLRKRPGTVSVSAVLHLALIAAGVALTPIRKIEKPPVDVLEIVYVDKDADRPGKPSGGIATGGPVSELPQPFPVPDIAGIDPVLDPNLSTIGSDPASDVRNSAVSGTAGGTIATGDGLYTRAAVEKPAIALPGNRRPGYPDVLRAAGIEGSVLVQFVIDTTGALESGSVRLLHSDHELFSAAVRNALGGHRFLPAEVGMKKVRMLVQQRFDFAIEK